MRTADAVQTLVGLALVAASASLTTPPARAHCDGMDGPVVKAAQKALETANVNLVLRWVRKPDEVLIKRAFEQTQVVRKLNGAAKELADQYFFETLVRVHRAGEGAPYTGLKPAGRDLGMAIPAADQALETKRLEPVVKLLTEKMENGLRDRFKAVVAAQEHAEHNVEAGREFVKAYVEYVHYVEGIHKATVGAAHEHPTEAPAASTPGATHQHNE